VIDLIEEDILEALEEYVSLPQANNKGFVPAIVQACRVADDFIIWLDTGKTLEGLADDFVIVIDDHYSVVEGKRFRKNFATIPSVQFHN
jgi:hypothetical protein